MFGGLRLLALVLLVCLQFGCADRFSAAHSNVSQECGHELPAVDGFFEQHDDGRKVLIDWVFLSQEEYGFPGTEPHSVDIATARAIMQARIGSRTLGQSKEERATGYPWKKNGTRWECLRLFTTEGYYYCVTRWQKA